MTACSGACTRRPALVPMAKWPSRAIAARRAARVMETENVDRPNCFLKKRERRVWHPSQVCASFGLGLASEMSSEGSIMRFAKWVTIACVVALFSMSVAAQEIRGDYLETRSADV